MLEKFNPKIFDDDSAAVSVDTVESSLGCDLPPAIRKYISKYDGALVFETNVAFSASHSKFAAHDGFINLEILYGRSDGFYGIVAANERYGYQLPLGSIAIGEIAGANIIGVKLGSEEVFLWLHDNNANRDDVTKISNSVDDFLGSLVFKPYNSEIELGVDMNRLDWTL